MPGIRFEIMFFCDDLMVPDIEKPTKIQAPQRSSGVVRLRKSDVLIGKAFVVAERCVNLA